MLQSIVSDHGRWVPTQLFGLNPVIYPAGSLDFGPNKAFTAEKAWEEVCEVPCLALIDNAGVDRWHFRFSLAAKTRVQGEQTFFLDIVGYSLKYDQTVKVTLFDLDNPKFIGPAKVGWMAELDRFKAFSINVLAQATINNLKTKESLALFTAHEEQPVRLLGTFLLYYLKYYGAAIQES